MTSTRLAVVAAGALAGLLGGVTAAPPDTWPGFRGPNMSGLAADARLATHWTTTENVTWTADIPGRGWSSPIIWDDTIYVTSAISDRPFKEPSPGIYGNDYVAELQAQGLSMDEILRRVQARDNEFPEESDEIRYMLYALDVETGQVRWEREAHKGLPFGGRHRKNTYASETPVTDGERIYAYFGQNIGLFAYSLEGDLLWTRSWEKQPIYLQFGTASSPVVHEGHVYLLQDSEERSFLTALDASSGEQTWRVERPAGSFPLKSGWSTPLIWQHAERTEIVTVGHGMVISYGLNGQELWRAGRATSALPSPVASADRLYVGTGAQTGGAYRPVFAIRPGASGDITLAEDATSNEFIAWMHPRASGYTPSALIYDSRAYVVHDNGILTVLDSDTGEQVYQARVGGVGHTFSASPIAASGRIYFPDEEGVTIVLEAGDTYVDIAHNDLGEMMLASPAVQGDALFLRTATRLYRIDAPTSTTVNGAWIMAMDIENMGPATVELMLAQDGETLTGTYTGSYGTFPLEGTLEDRTIAFSVYLRTDAGDSAMYFSGEVAEDAKSMFGDGSIEGLGAVTWSATPKPVR
jgi:outer membrane protein assembly factor BamB